MWFQRACEYVLFNLKWLTWPGLGINICLVLCYYISVYIGVSSTHFHKYYYTASKFKQLEISACNFIVIISHSFFCNIQFNSIITTVSKLQLTSLPFSLWGCILCRPPAYSLSFLFFFLYTNILSCVPSPKHTTILGSLYMWQDDLIVFLVFHVSLCLLILHYSTLLFIDCISHTNISVDGYVELL